MNRYAIPARILFALPFAVFGINHLLHAQAMTGGVPTFFPAAIRLYLVYFTGGAMIAACLAIATGIMARLAGVLLALMLLIFVLTIHLPLLLRGEQMAMISLLKDFALAAAALYVAATVKRG